MRSIVAALNYVEQLGGLHPDQSHCYDNDIISSTVENAELEQCKTLLLHGPANNSTTTNPGATSTATPSKEEIKTEDKPAEVQHFQEITENISTIAQALKMTLDQLDQLVPNTLYSKVINIQNGHEIEEFLVDLEWPDLNGLVFVEFLNHLTKACSLCRQEQQQQQQYPIFFKRANSNNLFSRKITKFYSDSLLRQSTHANVTKATTKKHRQIIRMITHTFANEEHETKKNASNAVEKCEEEKRGMATPLSIKRDGIVKKITLSHVTTGQDIEIEVDESSTSSIQHNSQVTTKYESNMADLQEYFDPRIQNDLNRRNKRIIASQNRLHMVALLISQLDHRGMINGIGVSKQ